MEHTDKMSQGETASSGSMAGPGEMPSGEMTAGSNMAGMGERPSGEMPIGEMHESAGVGDMTTIELPGLWRLTLTRVSR